MEFNNAILCNLQIQGVFNFLVQFIYRTLPLSIQDSLTNVLENIVHIYSTGFYEVKFGHNVLKSGFVKSYKK